MGSVHPLGDPVTHFWLTRSMARVVGVSLSEAMATGQLTPQDYAAMVTRCRRCGYSDACTRWLGTPANARSAAPAYCPHATRLEILARGLGD